MRDAKKLGVEVLVTAFACGCGSGGGLGGIGEQTGVTAAATTICGSTTVTGIDVYHGDNNGNAISWRAVAAGGASFAFAKATESTNFNDPMFATNWSGIKEAGMVRGAYHFFDPTADPTAQAMFFLQAVGTVSPGDLLVLDFETSGGESDSTLSSQAMTFLTAVQTATGTTPLLYASSEFLSDWGSLGTFPLWVANYNVSCPDVPSAWSTYTFWQNSGSGMVSGISAAVDTDSFNGTLAHLQALGGSGPTDGGSTVLDAGGPVDSGTSPMTDGGAGPEADSSAPSEDGGPPIDVDSGTPGVSDGGAPPTRKDAGGASTQDAGRLAPTEPASPPKVGCSCRTAGGRDSSSAALAAFIAVGALGMARRRRRANAPIS